jgi:peptidyl-prolyl cis-trans isomerase C
MKTKLLIALIPVLILVGCSNKEEASPETPPEASVSQTDADAVLVEVDGKVLTMSEANRIADLRLSSYRQQVPPAQMGAIRQQIRGAIVEEFVQKTILLNEAARQKITVTPKDEDETFEKIKHMFPGMTLDDILAQSAIGVEKMRVEFRNNIKISKLLAPIIDKEVTIPDEDIVAFMEQNKSYLERPETSHARHILIKFEKDDTDETKAEKKKKIEGIREVIAKGGDFAEQATAHSVCGSAERGGDLGSFPRGRMVPQFDKAAFSQKIGEVGPVIETEFGYHIIEVIERTEAQTATRDEVVEMMTGQQKQEQAKRYFDELKAKAVVKHMRVAQEALPSFPGMMPPPAR